MDISFRILIKNDLKNDMRQAKKGERERERERDKERQKKRQNERGRTGISLQKKRNTITIKDSVKY